MAEAEMEADKARKDSEGDKLDQLVEMMTGMKSCMDSVSARMDSFEEKEKVRADASRKDEDKEDKKEDAKDARKDSEEEEKKVERKADARKDSEENKRDVDEKEKKPKGEEREDSRADSITIPAKAWEAMQTEAAAQKARFDKLEAHMAPVSNADEALLAGIQSRADSVLIQFQKRARPPMKGETPMAYQKAMVGSLKSYSPNWKNVDMSRLDAELLTLAENQVYADALIASKNPTDLADGELREIVKIDASGRQIREFHGKPRAWMGQFMTNPGRLTGINLKHN